MSEILNLPESECARALGMLSQFVDGDLAVEQSAWLDRHLQACMECRAAAARFTAIDSELNSWGQRLGFENPPPADARERLAAKLAPLPARRRAARWMLPAAAAAIVAALAIAALGPHRKPTVVNRAIAQSAAQSAAPFVAIPYLPPLDPRENATVVRMNIRVASLIAAGYRITADPDAIVPADVLVGEDGRAHAVRVLSGIEWNGTGD